MPCSGTDNILLYHSTLLLIDHDQPANSDTRHMHFEHFHPLTGMATQSCNSCLCHF